MIKPPRRLWFAQALLWGALAALMAGCGDDPAPAGPELGAPVDVTDGAGPSEDASDPAGQSVTYINATYEFPWETLGQLILDSDIVAIGEVTDIGEGRDIGDQVYRAISLEVDEVFHGPVANSLVFEDGSGVAMTGELIGLEDNPWLLRGDRVLVTLTDSGLAVAGSLISYESTHPLGVVRLGQEEFSHEIERTPLAESLSGLNDEEEYVAAVRSAASDVAAGLVEPAYDPSYDPLLTDYVGESVVLGTLEDSAGQEWTLSGIETSVGVCYDFRPGAAGAEEPALCLTHQQLDRIFANGPVELQWGADMSLVAAIAPKGTGQISLATEAVEGGIQASPLAIGADTSSDFPYDVYYTVIKPAGATEE